MTNDRFSNESGGIEGVGIKVILVIKGGGTKNKGRKDRAERRARGAREPVLEYVFRIGRHIF